MITSNGTSIETEARWSRKLLFKWLQIILRQHHPPMTFQQYERVRFVFWFTVLITCHLAAFVYLGLTIPQFFSDTSLYFHYGQLLVAGQVPYQDFVLEYPPLVVPLFWLPARFAHDIVTFRLFFAVEMLVCDLFGAGVVLWAIKRFAIPLSPLSVAVVQPLWLVLAGRSLVFERFDLAPAILVLFALVLFTWQRDWVAWLVLGLAVALKLYPVVIVPFFVMGMWQRRAWRWRLADVGAFLLGTVGPALLVSRGNLVALTTVITYHRERGLEIEAVSASLLLVASVLTGSPLAHMHQYGAVEVMAPLAPLLTTLALPLTALTLLAVYAVAWRHHQVWSTAELPIRFEILVRLSAVAILVFMLAGKVLSPQFMLWLYPLLAVVPYRRAWIWPVFGLVLFLSQWIFPDHWAALLAFSPPVIGVLLLRNALLVGLVLLLLPTVRAATLVSSVNRERPASREGT